jgi:hypothetical protein
MGLTTGWCPIPNCPFCLLTKTNNRRMLAQLLTPASGSASTVQAASTANANSILANQAMPGGALTVSYTYYRNRMRGRSGD